MIDRDMRRSDALHENLDREEIVRAGSEREFGQLFCAIFGIVGTLQLWSGHAYWPLPFVVAMALLGSALVSPRFLYWPNRIWLAFGLLLHRVTQPLVLSVLFYVTVTPIAILMRLFGKDPLRLKFDRPATSYWIARDGSALRSMRKQF